MLAATAPLESQRGQVQDESGPFFASNRVMFSLERYRPPARLSGDNPGEGKEVQDPVRGGASILLRRVGRNRSRRSPAIEATCRQAPEQRSTRKRLVPNLQGAETKNHQNQSVRGRESSVGPPG